MKDGSVPPQLGGAGSAAALRQIPVQWNWIEAQD